MLLPEKNAMILFKTQLLSSLLSIFISFSQVPGTVAPFLPHAPVNGQKAQFSQVELVKEQSGTFNYNELRIYPPQSGHE